MSYIIRTYVRTYVRTYTDMCYMHTVYSGMQEWVIQIPSIPILVSALFPSLHLRIKFCYYVQLCISLLSLTTAQFTLPLPLARKPLCVNSLKSMEWKQVQKIRLVLIMHTYILGPKRLYRLLDYSIGISSDCIIAGDNDLTIARMRRAHDL